jgi:transcriptional regulator with XRE-family HTH domain
MSNINDLIVSRIKQTRIERGKTQQDLAKHLGRTSAAISDLERGKVQISASDLYRLSRYLNKPIEYFYGEEIGGPEIRDLITILRKEDSETQKQTVLFTTMMMNIQSTVDEMKNAPEDSEVQLEQIKKFFQFFIPFSVGVNQMTAQLNSVRDQLAHELELKGIDVSQLLPKNE